MSDVGLTHVALPVTDVGASVSFYQRYARMQVVHRRGRRGSGEVVWLSDLTRRFVVVLLELPEVSHRLGGVAHIGVACATREEVDELAAQAMSDGCTVQGPVDSGPPVGYWAFVVDPDGHNLELSHGQEVGRTVDDVGCAAGGDGRPS